MSMVEEWHVAHRSERNGVTAYIAIKKDGTWEYVVNKCHAQRFSRVEASMMMHIARLEHPTGLYFMKEAT
jgi:hypothetical protein